MTIAWARYPYEGTVVLVTGGGSGICRAVARAFAEQGAMVAVAGRRRAPLDDALDGVAAHRRLAITADVATAEGAAVVVDAVAERWGRLDVVVANAGSRSPERWTTWTTRRESGCGRSTWTD